LAQLVVLRYRGFMSKMRWSPQVAFRELVLEPDPAERHCAHCGQFTYIYEHRDRRLHTLEGPLHLVSKLAHCPSKSCPGHAQVLESGGEMAVAPPHWTIGWDVFVWMGHRRFARNWSVPQIRAELRDSHSIDVSPDLIEDYVKRYEVIVAARESSPERLADEYRDVADLVLTIDGLQPEKGHETLYVVRELRLKRVWFAIPLLSSSALEVKRVIEQSAAWAQRLGKPVRLWISDKQKAFVTGIAEVFPGVPHRYCANHFLRDLAKPVLEQDSHAKVQMRRKVRGLRDVERSILDERGPRLAADAAQQTPATPTASNPPASPPPSTVLGTPRSKAQDVVLEYAAAIRGVLNDDQGGPLDPPGLRMASALGEVRASLQRCTEREKGGLVRAN
jgi:hypothetical protein